FYNDFFLFLRITIPGLKYTISATSFTMIEWATERICAIFDEIFALTFSAGMYFSLNNHY
ncbi:MAG: hypothetical protein, partial [Olavius algarvensis Gamma 1 endosymbiont]